MKVVKNKRSMYGGATLPDDFDPERVIHSETDEDGKLTIWWV